MKDRVKIGHTRTLTTIGVLVFLTGAFAVSCTISLLSSMKETKSFLARETGSVSLEFDGVVLQDRANNCGAASLKMVLDHRGIAVSLREVQRKIKSTQTGSSLLALKLAAESCGLHAEGWRLKPEDLSRIPLPVILFVENCHFVVVDSLDAGGFFFVRDPAIGRVKIPTQRLIEIWKGEALVFGNDTLSGG